MRKILFSYFAVIATLLTVNNAYAQFTAINVTNGVTGAEPGAGYWTWGADFDVVSSIQVTDMGAFDSGSDGMFNEEVLIGIFNRDTQSLVSGTLVSFTTLDPGTANGGSRFKSLLSPVVLSAGFQGSIVATNYTGVGGTGETSANRFHQTQEWSFNDGGGLISEGSFRQSTSSQALPFSGITYPTLELVGVEASAVAAGNFMFEAAPVPEPSTYALIIGGACLGFVVWKRRRQLATAAE